MIGTPDLRSLPLALSCITFAVSNWFSMAQMLYKRVRTASAIHDTCAFIIALSSCSQKVKIRVWFTDLFQNSSYGYDLWMEATANQCFHFNSLG